MPNDQLLVLWSTMMERYGYRWTKQYGPTPLAAWARDLAGITPEQMMTGLASDLERGQEWPPSCSAFRTMCLGQTASNDPLHNLPITQAAIESDDHKKRRLATGKAAIAQIRERLGLPRKG